jgi:hypothetical protein
VRATSDQEGPEAKTWDFSEEHKKMDEVLRDVLRQCVEQGMQPPLILCVVSPNGSTMVMRTDGEHPEILAEHTEGAGFSTPINCMVVDRAGAAAHITIEPSGATAFH